MSTVTDTLIPLEIWEVDLEETTIKFFEPLVLQPIPLLPEEPGDRTYLTVEYPELDLAAVALNHTELLSCLRSDIRLTWKRVMYQPESDLSAFDRTIKVRFLEIAEEVKG
ncbi:MAG: hypothetical protein ACRC10_00185 [Thermoguttaceae bacterium]